MKTFLGSLGSNPSLDIFRAELLAIGDIQPQLSYFIQDTTKNFSFCNKNIKSGKSVISRKDLATTHLLFALNRCVTFPLRTLRSCRTLLQESFMLRMTWSLQTEEQALSRLGGEAQAEEQQIQGPLNMGRPGTCSRSGGKASVAGVEGAVGEQWGSVR